MIPLLLLAALTPKQSAAFVERARALVGTPYLLGGRLKPEAYGIDCQGVIFFAADALSTCGWNSYAVASTKAVATGEFGKAVAGMSPVSTLSADFAKLEPADLVLLVGFAKNPREPPIGTLIGGPVWVWHTGVYSGDGNWIVGDHYAGKVIETPLLPYLRAHSDTYAGVYVLRMSGKPKPPKCKKHAPMRIAQ